MPHRALPAVEVLCLRRRLIVEKAGHDGRRLVVDLTDRLAQEQQTPVHRHVLKPVAHKGHVHAREVPVHPVEIHDGRAIDIVGDVIVAKFAVAALLVKTRDPGAHHAVLARLHKEPAAVVLALNIILGSAQDAELPVPIEQPDRHDALHAVLDAHALVHGENVFKAVCREQTVPVKVQRRVHHGADVLSGDILEAVAEGAARAAVESKAQGIAPPGGSVSRKVLPDRELCVEGRRGIQLEGERQAQFLIQAGFIALKVVKPCPVGALQHPDVPRVGHALRLLHPQRALKVAQHVLRQQVGALRAPEPGGVPAAGLPEQGGVLRRDAVEEAALVVGHGYRKGLALDGRGKGGIVIGKGGGCGTQKQRRRQEKRKQFFHGVSFPKSRKLNSYAAYGKIVVVS